MQTIIDRLTGVGGLLRVRALIALALTAAVAYLFMDGQSVPADLQKMWILATALYFGPRIVADAGGG